MASNEPEESDESILNVFRRSDDEPLSTSQIADNLSITQRSVQLRLNSLESEGRLQSKPFGNSEYRLWSLAEDEPQRVVKPSNEGAVSIYKTCKDLSSQFYFLSKNLLEVAAILMLIFLTIEVQDYSIIYVENTDILLFAYSSAIVGAGLIGITAVLKLGSMIISRWVFES